MTKRRSATQAVRRGGLLCIASTVLVSLATQVAAGDSDPGREAQQGIERLASLAGEWQVTGTMLGLDGTAVKIRSRSKIERTLDGASLEERSSYLLPPNAVEFLCIRSWDSFRSRYRMACIDSLTGLLDVYEGELVNDRLVMTNLSTGTYAETNGTRMYGRQAVEDISDDSFLVTWEFSLDDGSTWQRYGRLQYRRQGTMPADPPGD